MGTQNNDEGVFVTTESGVVNTNTYPDQLRPHEDRADDQPLAVMFNQVQQSRDTQSEMIQTMAVVRQIIYSSKISRNCPPNFYECAISIPRMDLFEVTQKFPAGVDVPSQAIQNFTRAAEGYLESSPVIGQRLVVMAPKTADPSIMCVIIKSEDREKNHPNGKSAKLSKGKSGGNAVANGTPAPPLENPSG